MTFSPSFQWKYSSGRLYHPTKSEILMYTHTSLFIIVGQQGLLICSAARCPFFAAISLRHPFSLRHAASAILLAYVMQHMNIQPNFKDHLIADVDMMTLYDVS